MPDTFQLEIVTPEKMVVRDVAEEMQIPGKDGYLGILPGHAPLITELAVGEITYRKDNYTHHLAVAWGFAEVLPEKSRSWPRPPSAPKRSTQGVPRRPNNAPKPDLATCNTEEDFQPAPPVTCKRAETRLEVAAKKK